MNYHNIKSAIDKIRKIPVETVFPDESVKKDNINSCENLTIRKLNLKIFFRIFRLLLSEFW